jgi:SAM-dependent methyltransferase
MPVLWFAGKAPVLKNKTEFFENTPQKALHIAPEIQFEKRLRKKIGCGYVTADLFDKNVDIRVDITDIPYRDDYFDFVYCSHVLEHIPDDRKAIREIKRVLSDVGFAVIMVPINVKKTFEDPTVVDPNERLRLFGQKDHVRRYGPDFRDRLLDEGFLVDEFGPSDVVDEKDVIRYGLTIHSGEIFVCRKSSTDVS